MNHEFYMQRCLELAQLGAGNVAPNPMVGCVIVFENKIIGEGYHREFGETHAEVNAIADVDNKKVLEKSTLYVNLEPCVHFGKTPPCSDLIIKHKIPNVVIGSIDNNKLVSGKGVDHLKSHGVKVEINILEQSCKSLNKRFYTSHTKKRPYIILKWAETQDGFISRLKNKGQLLKDNWITSENSKVLSHQIRANEQAILIGKNTALNDNPSLTTRLVEGKYPIRILLCNNPSGLEDLKILNDPYPTIIFNSKIEKKIKNKEWIKFDGSIKHLLDKLSEKNIQSIIIEGGSNVLNQFITNNIWDEAIQFIGNKNFEKGIVAPALLKYNSKHTLKSGEDTVNHFYRCT